MSLNCKQFTYVNQLASSDTDASKREEWFTTACCPPNVLRLFGQLGGYIWSHKQVDTQAAEVAVHLYVSNTLSLDVGSEKVQIKQESEWPWKDSIKFNVQTISSKVTMKLRIPAWASSFEVSMLQLEIRVLKTEDSDLTQLTPQCPSAKLEKGYLQLSGDWIAGHPSFELRIPLKPRWLTQHPNATSHGLVTLARGPVIYCVEDFDNPWVEDHFKVSRNLSVITCRAATHFFAECLRGCHLAGERA